MVGRVREDLPQEYRSVYYLEFLTLGDADKVVFEDELPGPCHPAGLVHRVTVGTGAQCGQGNAPTTILVGQLETPAVGAGKQVRFVWSREGNPQKPLPVSVFARGLHVGDASLLEGWQASRWFGVPDGEGPALIEIRTPTFQPALHGRGDDRRILGLRLDLVEIR